MVLGELGDDELVVTTAFGILGERLREDIQQAIRDGDDGEDQNSRRDSVTDMTSSRGTYSVRE
jgi:hypothetical protein